MGCMPIICATVVLCAGCWGVTTMAHLFVWYNKCSDIMSRNEN